MKLIGFFFVFLKIFSSKETFQFQEEQQQPEQREREQQEEKSKKTEIENGNDKQLTFLLIGDWGKGGVSGDIRTTSTDVSLVEVDYNRLLKDNEGNKNQKKTYTYQVAIASSMSHWIVQQNVTPQFVVSLGDNFYDNGVSSAVEDTLWITHWRDVYLKNYTNLRIPWYPVFGNHDYGSGKQGVQAQLSRTHSTINDYSNQLWQFPSTNYSKIFSIPGGRTVGIVFVDTTTLAPSQNKCCNQNGGVSIEEQMIRISNQISHLHQLFQEMVEKKPTWLLVAGHYPIFSRGEHGDISELKENLLPLLLQYKVNAYICGHDHIAEHLQASNIEFFVVGAGAMTSSLYNTQTDAKLIWSGVGYSSFASIDASISTLTITYVRSDQTVVYNYTLTTPYTIFEDGERGGNEDDDEDDEGNHDDEGEDYGDNETNDDGDGDRVALPPHSDKSNSSHSNKVIQIVTIVSSVSGVIGVLSLGIVLFIRRYQKKDFHPLAMNSPAHRQTTHHSSPFNQPPPALSYLLPYNKLSKKQNNKLKTSYHQTKLHDDIEKQQQQQNVSGDEDDDMVNEEKISSIRQFPMSYFTASSPAASLGNNSHENNTTTNNNNSTMRRNDLSVIHKKAKSMPM